MSASVRAFSCLALFRCAHVACVARGPDGVRGPGGGHVQVGAHDGRVALGALQPGGQRLALLVHRRVGQGVALALHERALVLVLGGMTRQPALVRPRQMR